MSNHGHVKPNPDGSLARCGGPAICSVCAKEWAVMAREERDTLTAENERLKGELEKTKWTLTFENAQLRERVRELEEKLDLISIHEGGQCGPGQPKGDAE